MSENTSTKFNTTDQYRVTGPAVYCGSKPSLGVKTGDIITLDLTRVDGDGDVGVKGAGFILATSLTPVTEQNLGDDIRIPRADLPEVVASGKNLRVGQVHYAGDPTAQSRRKEALRLLAIAEYLEARESEAAAAEAKRDQRRDELAREFAEDAAYAYRFAGPEHQAAIDRIIDLEAQVPA